MTTEKVKKRTTVINPLRRVKWRLLLLCVALAGVFFFMRYVTSTSFQEGMQMIFGDLRSWNWCPQGVTKITFEGAAPETVTDPENVRKLCQIAFQPAEADVVAKAHFVRLMNAESASGALSVIEGDLSNRVFRANGLPFQSPSLEKAWTGRTPP